MRFGSEASPLCTYFGHHSEWIDDQQNELAKESVLREHNFGGNSCWRFDRGKEAGANSRFSKGSVRGGQCGCKSSLVFLAGFCRGS